MPANRRSSVTIMFRCPMMPQFLTTCLAAAAIAVLLLAGSAMPAAAQSVVAVVNGLPITTYDIEQRSRLIRLSQHKSPTHQQVLDELINEKVKLREAERWSVEVTTKDVDNAFANMAKNMGMSAQQLDQALTSQGVDPKTLKAKIRSDLGWGQLVRGRFQSSLQVGERDIQNFIRKNGEAAQASVGYQYTLRPILFIVPQGSPASAFEARAHEADSLRSRFQRCDEGLRFARALRDVAVREPIIKVSADLPEPLRKVLNSLEVGHLTAPEKTPQGVQVFALCGKKTMKSDTPGQHAAREEIFAKKYDQQSKRYLSEVRRRSMIEYKSHAR